MCSMVWAGIPTPLLARKGECLTISHCRGGFGWLESAIHHNLATRTGAYGLLANTAHEESSSDSCLHKRGLLAVV